MQKVVRRVINNTYIAIYPDILKEGVEIDFDCYIKRFDDYVIIIEAGTLITPELAVKLKRHKKIYILNSEMKKIKAYMQQYGLLEMNAVSDKIRSVQEIIPIVMRLNEELKQCEGNDNRIHKVYETTSALMEAIFHEMSETLPLNALDICVDTLVQCLNIDERNVIPLVLGLMPEEYSTHHHSTNVALFAIIVAKATGLTKQDIIDVAYAGLLHDIGKMRIDRELLLKPAYLENEEFDVVQRHAAHGFEILQKNGIQNQKILDAVHYHHEKLDGKGYPAGLRGRMIPKFARIIAVCDVFDALTTMRTFRSGYSSFEALSIIKQQMREQFDEFYTDMFIRLLGTSPK